MMKSWELDKVEAAMNALLASIASVEVIWDNQPGEDGAAVDPPSGLYYEQYMLPGTGSNIEIGQGGRYRNVGVYQITIVGVMYNGKKDLGDKVAELLEGFKPGTRVPAEDGTVLVTNSSASRGFPEGERYRLPVSVYWQVDTTTE